MKILFEMSGGMGDEICTLPTVKAIHDLYPEAHISCKYKFRELFVGNDFIHDFPRSDLGLDRKVYDKLYLFRWAMGSYAFLSGIHLVDVYSSQMKIDLSYKGIDFVKIFDEEKEKFKYIKEKAKGRPIICYDIFASSQANRWSSKRFREVVKRLEENENAMIIQIGNSKSEWQGIGNYAIGLPLRDMAALMSQCDMYIGNNSGAAHLASALRIPSVKIYSATNPECYTHFPDIERIVYSPIECRGCLNNKPGKNPLVSKEKCPQAQWLCKDLINVDDVYNACIEHLEKTFHKGE